MKYPPLIGLCKDCLGCQRLEDPNFRGVYKCRYVEKPGKIKEMSGTQERMKI